MRLSQLEYLVYLHKCGTFSKAADALYVSQPAISLAIRELEHELGFPLLVRNHKGIEFTPEGLQVLEKAQSILREMEGIRCIRKENDDITGTCVLGASPHFCSSVLLEVQLYMQRTNPKLHIVSREGDSLSVLHDLEENHLQLGIVQLCDMEEGAFWRQVEKLGLQYTELFTEEMCVGVGDHHPLAKRGRVPFQELAQFPYGTYRGCMNQQIRFLLQNIPAPLVFAMDDIGPLRQLIFRQNAYTVIPARAFQRGNALFQNQMVPLEIENMPLASRIVMLRNQAAINPMGDAVVQALLAACQRYLDS